jgi:peptide deformylase
VSILKIMEWPEKVLETRAQEVTQFDEALRKFVGDMFETMEDARGIGLAANQVGDLRRILVIHIPKPEKDDNEEDEGEVEADWWHGKPMVFINPRVDSQQGKTRYQEGCLSFPGIYEYIERSTTVRVQAVDEFGKEFEIEANGLLAICLQHEIDHLDGIVFVERMSRLKANLVRKKLLRKNSFHSE